MLEQWKFDGGRQLVLKDMPTGAGELAKDKKALAARTDKNLEQVALLQEKLYAEGREGLVVAIQARDAAGKDSLVKKVFGALNPAGLQVTPFKTPSKEDLSHDYLWRINKALPPRGSIGVFNRSQYEDVLVTRVHQMEKGYAMPERVTGDADFYPKRYVQLRNWENYLYENGYRMVKILLNVSREEQKKRFLDRMELPEKHYKLSLGDLEERALWEAYDVAYEDAVNATGTKAAPWYVLPADDKWFTRYLVSEILLETLTEMDPQFPGLDAEDEAALPAAIEALKQD